MPFSIFLKTLQPWHALLVAAGHLFSRWIQLAERDSRGQSRFHRLHRQLPRLRDYRYPLRKGLALFQTSRRINASHHRPILMRVCASDRLLDHLLERERGRARESEGEREGERKGGRDKWRQRERETERKGDRDRRRGRRSPQRQRRRRQVVKEHSTTRSKPDERNPTVPRSGIMKIQVLTTTFASLARPNAPP